MNDQPVSTLAIAEKRPQRPGGCVGIFFQLFDWNRRMAKKKLFSKKLLPPVRAKRLSKRFDGDEKLPTSKLLLIADENRGGFPNAKKADVDGLCSSNDPERNTGMRTPGLVARLMGLESMPAVRRDKPKKPSVPEFYNDQEKKSTIHDNHGKTPDLYYYNQDSNSEKGQAKADSRPQKLQKTGFFDRRPVTKFGAEALQFKSVLSRSRKQHHHKLASPLKSPRILSGRNAARLMEAATKILEPGLQATNRAKCSLTYSGSPHLTMEHRASVEGTDASFLKQSRQPTYPFGAKSLKVQSSCNSCGNLLDLVDSWSRVEERVPDFASSASDFSNTSSHGSGKSKVEPSEVSIEQERDADSGRSVFGKGQEEAVSLASQAKANVQRSTQNIVDRKLHIREDRNQSMPSRQCKPERAVPSNALKQNNQRQNQMLVVKDKVAHKPKSCSRQIRSDPASNAYGRAKDYVALNKNLSNLNNRTRLPAKVLDNCRMDMERNACSKRDDSSSRVKTLARKRRPITSNPTVENTGFINSNFGKQQSVRSDVSRINGVGFNGHAVNRSSVKTGSWKLMEGNGSSSSMDADIVSFAFSSPMRHDNTRSLSSAELEKRPGGGEVQSNVISETKNGNLSSLRASDFKGDALGALLEEKLRELTCSDRDEMETCDSHAGRSTASILQELISALSMVKPISEGNGNNCSDSLSSKDSLCNGSPDQTFFVPNHGQVFDTNRKLKTEAEVAVSAQFPLAPDSDHPSPTSILEASFSNDCCFSGSLDGSSGHKLHHTSMGRSHDLTQPAYRDSELSDSATSTDAGAAKTKKIASCIDKVSRVFSLEPAKNGLTGSMLNYARDVISCAELLFENLALYDADGMGDSVIETLASDLWRSHECGLEFTDAKEGGLLRRFLFDCMIECLDSKYSQYCNLGFRAWSKLPLFLSRHGLAEQVHEEIGQWRYLGANILDEIVEREMNHSMRKWADFKVETFEVGREIEGDILQILLDEVVLDLWQCY
ncbi:uncharacterized protein LOC131237627 [Magnolia sinica]|uniref:uncharacterized protein LOC131237627 n=1 Tax=Magnolia sinica TaxID=86752 RepID=UPI002658FA7A|nr:uncharacterized protein LOC131237627 [Magnolia sinica]